MSMESPHKDSEPDTHTVTQCACVCARVCVCPSMRHSWDSEQ